MKKIINFFKQKNVIVWVINFTLSIVLLFVGYKVTRNKFINLNGEGSAKEATVIEVLDKSEESYEVDGEKQITYNITFKAKLSNLFLFIIFSIPRAINGNNITPSIHITFM